MSRYEGELHNLDHDKQLRFFERRAETATPDTVHAATTFSEFDEAEQRHAAEVNQVWPLLDFDGSSVILDIGCGGARWSKTALADVVPAVSRYVGVDFSPKLISLAKGRGFAGSYFYVQPADDLNVSMLKSHGPYTHCIVTAVCLYMNDFSVEAMLASLAEVMPSGSFFYWREPVSLTGKRLTLIDEFSQKIGDDYNAAYRTPAEYEGFIFRSGAFELQEGNFLQDSSFQRHATTKHRYMIMTRR